MSVQMARQQAQDGVDRFRAVLSDAALEACREYGYGTDAVDAAVASVPTDILGALGRGLDDDALVIAGSRFSLRGLGPKKGPYTLFSPDPVKKRPMPNIEYYVQIAEFPRLTRQLTDSGLVVGFEDNLMDVTVRRDGNLVLYVEAKDTSTKVRQLLDGMLRYSGAVPIEAPDRGIDSLRKAKYLVRHRPNFFSAMGIGLREDYAVDYEDGGFRLRARPAPPTLPELLAA
jgi:hypothetical protein